MAFVTFFSVSELFLLLYVAELTDFFTTFLLCILTGLVGGILIRWQGLATIARMQSELKHGRIPADEIIGGILLIVMGVLLCVPGFITDTLGFLIIVPSVRKLVAGLIRTRFKAMVPGGSVSFHHDPSETKESGSSPFRESEIIDVEPEP